MYSSRDKYDLLLLLLAVKGITTTLPMELQEFVKLVVKVALGGVLFKLHMMLPRLIARNFSGHLMRASP